MRVAILGCGPAGLMAAHAAKISGAKEVDIYSKKRKSELFGAQYLHSPIPGMTESAPRTVRYVLKGSNEDYRRKVYGDDWDGSVSTEEHEGDHDAWDIRTTYNNLWETYADLIYPTDISKGWLSLFAEQEIKFRYDFVFSTIPRPLLCTASNTHKFESQTVWVAGDAPERGIFVSRYTEGINRNTVVCSGDSQDRWYRMSKVFGHSTVEWPNSVFPADPTATLVEKPLRTDCDCYPSITKIGRFGRWQKGVLADSAFHQVQAMLMDARLGAIPQ